MQEVKMEMQEKAERKPEYRMGFEIPQVELRIIFEYFKKCLNSTVLFHASEDGVTIAAMSAERVVLGVVYINRSCMKNYSVTENHTFALDLDSLKRSLLLLKDKQAMLTFIQNEDEITVTSGDGFTRTVMVSDDIVDVRVPEIKYDSGGVVDSGDFCAAVNMVADTNDAIHLSGDGKNLVVSAFRDQRKKIAVEAPLKLKAGGFRNETKVIASEYLKNAAVALKHFDLMVRMKSGTDREDTQPVKINFRKAVLSGEVKGYMLIAPIRGS